MPAQTVIQLRRDTAANWESADSVLAAGEIGFDSTNNQIKIGDGTTAWTVLPYASGASGASVEISETAPADPEAGDVWFDSTDGRAYIYYDSFWVDLNPGVAGPAGPAGPTGSTGPSGVIAVTAPITNSGTSTSANLGINQSDLQINMGQVATTVTSQADAYAIIAANENTFIRSDSANAVNITIANVLNIGQSVQFIQTGAGQVTFVAGAGVTLRSVDNKLKINKQFSVASATCIASGEYLITGDLVA
jgi:hypothetical protein